MQIVRRQLFINNPFQKQVEVTCFLDESSQAIAFKAAQQHQWIKQVFFMTKKQILIIFNNMYAIIDYQINQLIFWQKFQFIVDDTQLIKHYQTNQINLLIVMDKPKRLIVFDPYKPFPEQPNINCLYDFQKEQKKHSMEVTQSLLVLRLSGYFCLLRVYCLQTQVIVFNSAFKRVKNFLIHQQCLSSYDHICTLVNYRQSMRKPTLEVTLTPIYAKQDQKTIERVNTRYSAKLFLEERTFQIAFQQNVKGIVIFVGKTKQNQMILALNGTAKSTLTLFDVQTQQIKQTVFLDRATLSLNLLSYESSHFIVRSYSLNQKKQTVVYEVILDASNLKGNSEVVLDDEHLTNKTTFDWHQGVWMYYQQFDISRQKFQFILNKVVSYETTKSLVLERWLQKNKLKQTAEFFEQAYWMIASP